MEQCIFCHTEYQLNLSDSNTPSWFCSEKCEDSFDKYQEELRRELRRIRKGE